MRVAIAGAGAVGRSIAAELLESEHQVMLIERELSNIEPEAVEAAEWVHADACELASLEEAGLEDCDVVIAATGDDKVNLVVSLLAKTEFAVRRVVARVNDPRNEWLFDDSWGVDVAVSTPRLLAALVEEAVRPGRHQHHRGRRLGRRGTTGGRRAAGQPADLIPVRPSPAGSSTARPRRRRACP